jgi:acyl-coenzyme A thioesterase PaaI-like protein
MNPEPKIKKDILKMREEWRKLPDYGCFWSSPDNSRGLKLTPKIELGKVSVEMLIEREHSGIPGIAHGGIAFTIIDGLMGWYIISHEGRAGFTTQATTQYRGPLKVGKKYLFEAVVDQAANPQPGTISMLGRVLNADNPDPKKSLVEIRAQFILPNRDLAKKVLDMDFGEHFRELFPEK